jgi:hypothetical protein
MGNGSSSLSLSRTGIRRSPLRGLPASRRHSPRQAEFRSRGRTVQSLSAAEFQVRLFSSLQLVVAPPACEPGQDTPAIFSRLNHLVQGQPPFLTARSPGTTGLASSLIDCFFSQYSGVVCNIAGLWKFLHATCLAIVTFPLRALFLSAFRRF